MTTVVRDADIRVMEKYASKRTHNAIITSFLREDDVVTSFSRNNDVIIASLVRWVTSLRMLLDGIIYACRPRCLLLMTKSTDLPWEFGNACGVCITSKLKENSEVFGLICKILFTLGRTHIEYMSKYELFVNVLRRIRRIFPRELLPNV